MHRTACVRTCVRKGVGFHELRVRAYAHACVRAWVFSRMHKRPSTQCVCVGASGGASLLGAHAHVAEVHAKGARVHEIHMRVVRACVRGGESMGFRICVCVGVRGYVGACVRGKGGVRP